MGTQITPTGIKFDGYDDEQTKPICSVGLVEPDESGNISLDLSSIQSEIDLLESEVASLEQNANLFKTLILEQSKTTVNEGDPVTITLITTNVFNGGRIPYTITTNGIDLNNDFTSPVSANGNFEIQNNSDSLTLTIKEDFLTENLPESFTLTLNAGDNPSVTVNVIDTSQTLEPTYSLNASPNPVTEHESVTVTLSTTDVDDGTYVPYTIHTSVLNLTEDFTSIVSSTGNFQVYGNQATKIFTLKQDDLTERLAESFTITVNAGTNPSVTVNVTDTSKTPETILYTHVYGKRLGWFNDYKYSVSDSHVEEYLSIWFRLFRDNGPFADQMPPVGTTVNWTVTPIGDFTADDFTKYASQDSDFTPGALSGTSVVSYGRYSWNADTLYLDVTFRLVGEDTWNETGEGFTITFSNIPNHPNISKTIYVFDPYTENDIVWG